MKSTTFSVEPNLSPPKGTTLLSPHMASVVVGARGHTLQSHPKVSLLSQMFVLKEIQAHQLDNCSCIVKAHMRGEEKRSMRDSIWGLEETIEKLKTSIFFFLSSFSKFTLCQPLTNHKVVNETCGLLLSEETSEKHQFALSFSSGETVINRY